MRTLLFLMVVFAAAGAFAGPTAHWQFAVLPEEDAPVTLLVLEIADDAVRSVPVGVWIGSPQDMEAADGPPRTLLHGGVWWAGQGQYWAVTSEGKSLQVWTRSADEGGFEGEGGGFGDWESVTTVPLRSKTAPVAEESVTIDLDRRLSLQKIRMNGPDVVLLQQLLALKGHGDLAGADGYFGPQTDRWVKAFQKDSGLEADGIVGPKTWKALMVGFASP